MNKDFFDIPSGLLKTLARKMIAGGNDAKAR